MSVAIQPVNGTCPCRACQRAIYRTPTTRLKIKRAKLLKGTGLK